MKFLAILLFGLFITLQSQAQFALKYVVEVKMAVELTQVEMVQNLIIKPAAATSTNPNTNEVLVRIVDPTTETIDYINALEAANMLTKLSETFEFLEDTCLTPNCNLSKKPKFGIPGKNGGGPKLGPIDEGGGGGMDIHPNTCKKYDLDCTPHKEGDAKPATKIPKCFKTSNGLICF